MAVLIEISSITVHNCSILCMISACPNASVPYFYCKPTGKCLDPSVICNLRRDCPDDSDEVNCSQYSAHCFVCQSRTLSIYRKVRLGQCFSSIVVYVVYVFVYLMCISLLSSMQSAVFAMYIMPVCPCHLYILSRCETCSQPVFTFSYMKFLQYLNELHYGSGLCYRKSVCLSSVSFVHQGIEASSSLVSQLVSSRIYIYVT